MITTQVTSHQKTRVDSPHQKRFSHVFNRLLSRWNQPAPVLESLSTVSIIRLNAGTTAARQRRDVVRLLRGILAHRNQLILDVSQLDDHDMCLPQLILDAHREAGSCRLNLVVGGISDRQQLLLEMTRITQIVRCFKHDSDAVRACLLDRDCRESEQVSISRGSKN